MIFCRSIQRKGIGSHVRELKNLFLFDSIIFMQRRKVKLSRIKKQTLLSLVMQPLLKDGWFKVQMKKILRLSLLQG